MTDCFFYANIFYDIRDFYSDSRLINFTRSNIYLWDENGNYLGDYMMLKEEKKQIKMEPFLNSYENIADSVSIYVNGIYIIYGVDEDTAVITFLNLGYSYLVTNGTKYTSYRFFVETDESNYYVYFYMSNRERDRFIVKFDESLKEEFDDYIDLFEKSLKSLKSLK